MGLVLPKLVTACAESNGRYTAEDIIQNISDNSMQIWLAFNGEALDGFILTQMLSYPHARTVRFMCAAGVGIDGPQEFVDQIKDWMPFMQQVEDWAYGLGCSLSQIEAPPQWAYYIKHAGYGSEHVLFSKRLSQ